MRGNLRQDARRGLTLIEVIVVIVVLAVVFWLAMVVYRPRPGLSRRAICASNLRGIGQGLHIYATDHGGSYPHHYFESQQPDATGDGSHGITWIGTMGSHEELRISQATSSTLGPKRGHASRSLFLLIISGQSTSSQFRCPESGDNEDELRNFGPDPGGGQSNNYAQPGRNRFDFRGYDSLSYGSQLPFGPAGRPGNTLDPRMPVMADKGPFFEAGIDAIRQSKTTADRVAHVRFPSEWRSLPGDKLKSLPHEAWKRFNSRNHDGEGQVVLFVDGHAEFAKTPLVGLNNDNIYTINPRPGDAAAGMLGTIPADAPLAGPRCNSDSYIVP